MRNGECTYLIAAPGRAGAEWFTEQCKDLGLSFINNQVDIGVRVEVPAQVFKHITDEVYEAKLVYRTQRYNDLVRTFCMNPNLPNRLPNRTSTASALLPSAICWAAACFCSVSAI